MRLDRLPLTPLLLSIATPLCILSYGCSGLKSRYAMSDPVYAEKYAEGAEKSDVLGKAKQALDARHTKGLSGWSIGGGAVYRPKYDSTLGGGEIGYEHYPQNWLSHRMSLATYLSDDDGFVGLDTGLRAQFPARVTPFVGVGGFLGASRTVSDAPDGKDNDDDGVFDETGEEWSNIDHLLAAIYPEVGVHAWINGCWRATVSGRYMNTSLSSSHDDWMLGGQLTYFPPRIQASE